MIDLFGGNSSFPNLAVIENFGIFTHLFCHLIFEMERTSLTYTGCMRV